MMAPATQPKGEPIPAPKAKEMPKGQVLAPVPSMDSTGLEQ
jgi:hypothetical protein